MRVASDSGVTAAHLTLPGAATTDVLMPQARSMGTTTDVRFMTNLVNAAAKSRRWVMASQLMQLMRSYGVLPNEITYTSILSQMSKAKQVRHKHVHGCSSKWQFYCK